MTSTLYLAALAALCTGFQLAPTSPGASSPSPYGLLVVYLTTIFAVFSTTVLAARALICGATLALNIANEVYLLARPVFLTAQRLALDAIRSAFNAAYRYTSDAARHTCACICDYLKALLYQTRLVVVVIELLYAILVQLTPRRVSRRPPGT